MILTCNGCGREIEIESFVAINLRCSVCGSNSSHLDVNAERTCVLCGFKENIKKGEEIIADHSKEIHLRRHKIYTLSSTDKSPIFKHHGRVEDEDPSVL